MRSGVPLENETILRGCKGCGQVGCPETTGKARLKRNLLTKKMEDFVGKEKTVEW